MSAIASPEFISLCQAQLRLLTQQIAESTAALYMADIVKTTAGETSRFVPVVSYPESIDSWTKRFSSNHFSSNHFSSTEWESSDRVLLALPGTSTAPTDELSDEEEANEAGADREDADGKVDREVVGAGEAVRGGASREGVSREDVSSETSSSSAPPDKDDVSQNSSNQAEIEKRLVVPLIYTDVVVGLLVAVRRDRSWDSKERSYVETMADSLAAGCVLERRNQWLQSSVAHRRGLQSRQSEVFHNLLHQFRNPLTAVNTFGKLLVKRLGPNDPNQTVATGIVRETSRLRELVTHFDETVALGDADLEAATPVPLLSPGQPLLPQAPLDSTEFIAEEGRSKDFSTSNYSKRGQSQEADLDNSLGHALTLSRQSLANIVDPILEVASIVAAEKGVRLHAQISRNTPLVWGEEEALSEVVSNLVDNAVKYSPGGAQVWVQTGVSRLEDIHQYQGIVVADTGPGIPAADLERLFERYYRGVQAQGDLPGTGLGLAIAQSLIREMQGAIEVISPAVGTPWLPVDIQEDEMQEEAGTHADIQIGNAQVENAEAHSGPGTVFIVWLPEAE